MFLFEKKFCKQYSRCEVPHFRYIKQFKYHAVSNIASIISNGSDLFNLC
jgi:hypothetical protein